MNKPLIDFHKILESISDYILILDKDLNLSYCNHKSESFFKSSLENIVGKSLLVLFPGLKGTKAESIYRSVIKSGESQSFIQDFNLYNKIWSFEINVYPYSEGLIVYGKSITECKLANEGKHSETLFRATLDNLLEGCAIFSTEWKYLYVNEANAKHAHHKRAELIGNRLPDLFPGIEDSPIFKAYERVMKSRIPEEIVNDFTFPDGSLSWFEIKIVPVPEGIFILSTDITERIKNEEKLFRYQSIFNQTEKMAHLGSWWIDEFYSGQPDRTILMWSDEVYNIFGREKGIKLTQQFFMECVYPDDRENVSTEIINAIKEKRAINVEHRIVLPDGSIRRVMENGIITFDKQNNPCSLVGAVQDITEFREAVEEREKLLKEIATERDKLKIIIESVPQEIWIVDSENQKVTINNAVKESLGLNPSQELTMDDILSSLRIQDTSGNIRLKEQTPLIRSMNGETVTGDEIIFHPDTGEPIYRHYHSLPVRDNSGHITAVLAIVNDITEQKKTEEFIKASLKEKEILLRELYHRTKNNMQVISSLLGLKAAALNNKDLSSVFTEMNNRIQAIALVHQKLYQSNNLSKIDLAEYISDLVNLLITSYSVTPDKINVERDMHSVSVLLDTAVPCGLIVNELVSNSLKYAFPGNKKGCILIKLAKINEQIELTIADNGIGLKQSDIQENSKLGLQLFRMIAEDQLQAVTTLDTSNGTSWNISFQDELYKERV